MWKKVKNFFLDILFPKSCFGCGKDYNPPTILPAQGGAPGSYLCEDCQSILEISGFHQKYSTQNLKDLYFAVDYQRPLIKNLIQKFKYEPYVKELAIPLSSLIICHFQLLEHPPLFFSGGSDFVLIPVPLEKRKLKRRGFNQAEEIGKELSKFFEISLISDCLIKIKETVPQVELADEARRENVKGVFSCQNREKIQGRKILLVDDIYTTGSTMEECARVLKESNAKEVIGIVVARG